MVAYNVAISSSSIFSPLSRPGTSGLTGEGQGRGDSPGGTSQPECRLPSRTREVRACSPEAGVHGGEGGPCSLQLPGWPDLGKKLALMSGLPAVTHRVPARGGAPPSEIPPGRLPSLGVHFSWSNNLKKRLLWFESQGQVRAGKACAITAFRSWMWMGGCPTSFLVWAR